jgi:hypothetical protein
MSYTFRKNLLAIAPCDSMSLQLSHSKWMDRHRRSTKASGLTYCPTSECTDCVQHVPITANPRPRV